MSSDMENYKINAVKIWLYTLAFLVFCMVIVGGATRLTDSGLSITEWLPIMGIIPPLSLQEWEIALEKYRQIPEYQLINKGMSMAQFQFIYWWEWGHRFLGRLIGFAFLVPFIFFCVKRYIAKKDMPKMFFLFVLGGFQGFLGWWMVASGLTDRVDVSQYRLAVHLTSAAIILAAIIMVARNHGLKHKLSMMPSSFFIATFIMIGLTLTQIFLGGLVAGLDAGLTYTTWPLMDGDLFPPSAKLLVQEPWYINFGENPLTVQFVHRMTAYLLWGSSLIYLFYIVKVTTIKPLRAGAAILVLALSFQAMSGIITLVMQVPIFWALIHQGGAMAVLSLLIWQLTQRYRNVDAVL